MQSIPYTESNELCQEIVQYVARTRENVIINDACSEDKFQNSPYILKNKTKSVLCMPVIYQNSLKGVVYLENNLSDNVFTLERLEILKILSSQTSISIDNARLYENMEEKIEERTLQLRDANDKLKELSLHDPLTNLHNRRYTYEYVSDYANKFITNKIRIINNCEKRETSPKTNVLAVYLIDIDHFKEVNDTYGHQAGDIVLVTISKVLKDLIRSNDFIIRWGGEEFLIILNDTKPDYLTIFSKKIITAVRDTPIELPEHNRIFITCSLGFTSIPLIPDNPELLNLEQTINLSDYALYCAKENGRNCAAHFQLNNEYIAGKNIKECITNLSKCTKLDQDLFNIEFIK
jgi:diguanylate cyclase (GGDEF)-like protein